MAQFLNYKIISKKTQPITPPSTPHTPSPSPPPPQPPPASLSSIATPNTPNKLKHEHRPQITNSDVIVLNERRFDLNQSSQRGYNDRHKENSVKAVDGVGEDALSFHDDSSYDYYFVKKNKNQLSVSSTGGGGGDDDDDDDDNDDDAAAAAGFSTQTNEGEYEDSKRIYSAMTKTEVAVSKTSQPNIEKKNETNRATMVKEIIKTNLVRRETNKDDCKGWSLFRITWAAGNRAVINRETTF